MFTCFLPEDGSTVQCCVTRKQKHMSEASKSSIEAPPHPCCLQLLFNIELTLLEAKWETLSHHTLMGTADNVDSLMKPEEKTHEVETLKTDSFLKGPVI